MRVPTVKVVKDCPRGWHIINESDYDPNVHTLFVEDEATPAEIPPPPAENDKDKDPLDELKEWDDWRNTRGAGVAKLKDIAQALTGRTPADKDEAVAMIDAEIAARAAPPPPPAEIPPPPAA